MNCEEVIRLRDGYLDGELDPVTNGSIESHLAACATCAEAYQSQRALIAVTRSAAPYHNASEELRERIRDSLGAETPPPLSALPKKIVRPPVFSTTRWPLLAMAAAIALAAVVAVTVVSSSRRTEADHLLATELIAGHARSLMANHMTDVLSSDRHTVKPWLDARLDFAPPVVDLADAGFPLLGGRLDYLARRPVAALVYKRRDHFINLFVWPADATTDFGPRTISRQGYHLLHWTTGDMTWWAVSDVNADELRLFQEQFIARVTTH